MSVTGFAPPFDGGEDALKEGEFYVQLQWPDGRIAIARADPGTPPWRLLKAHTEAVGFLSTLGAAHAAVCQVHTIRSAWEGQ